MAQFGKRPRAREGSRGVASATPCASAQRDGLRRYFARRAPAADVDDLVQEVYVKLQAARPGGPIVDLERYLFAIARHVLADRSRGQARRGLGLHDALAAGLEPACELSPERILVGRQDCARALAAVRDLPPRARAAFQFRRFEDMSYAAIADRMGISRDSVKELLRRANARLCHVGENSLPRTPPLSIMRRQVQRTLSRHAPAPPVS